MNRKLLSLAAGPILLAATILPAASATAGSPSRHETLRLKVTFNPGLEYHNGYISPDNDYTPAGKLVSFDVTTARAADPSATSAIADVAIARRDGLLIVSFVERSGTRTFHGKVLGGTGRYVGATGSVTVREQGASAAVTIRMTLH